MTNEAPERIWAYLDGPFVGLFVSGGFTDGGTEYLRSDLARPNAAAEIAWEVVRDYCDEETADQARRAILTALEGQDDG